jgi:hypothetical protein
MLAVLYKQRVQTQQLNYKMGESHSTGVQVSNKFRCLHIINSSRSVHNSWAFAAAYGRGSFN